MRADLAMRQKYAADVTALQRAAQQTSSRELYAKQTPGALQDELNAAGGTGEALLRCD